MLFTFLIVIILSLPTPLLWAAESCEHLAKDLKEISGLSKGSVLQASTKTVRMTSQELKAKLKTVFGGMSLSNDPKADSSMESFTWKKIGEDWTEASDSLKSSRSVTSDRLARAKMFFFEDYRRQYILKSKTTAFCSNPQMCTVLAIRNPEQSEKFRQTDPNGFEATRMMGDIGVSIKVDAPTVTMPRNEKIIIEDEAEEDEDISDREDTNFDLADFIEGFGSDLVDKKSDILYEATYDSDGLRTLIADGNSPRKKILEALSETYEKLNLARAKSQGIGQADSGEVAKSGFRFNFRIGPKKKTEKPPATEMKGTNETSTDSSDQELSDLETKLKTQLKQLAEVMKPEKIVRVSTLSQKAGVSKIVATFDTGKSLTIECNKKHQADFIDGLFCNGKSKDLSELQKTLCERLSSYTSFQRLPKFEEDTILKPGRPGRR